MRRRVAWEKITTTIGRKDTAEIRKEEQEEERRGVRCGIIY